MTGKIPFLLEMQLLSLQFVILIAVEDIDKTLNGRLVTLTAKMDVNGDLYIKKRLKSTGPCRYRWITRRGQIDWIKHSYTNLNVEYYTETIQFPTHFPETQHVEFKEKTYRSLWEECFDAGSSYWAETSVVS